MDFVIAIDNFQIKGGIFEDDRLINTCVYPCDPFPEEALTAFLALKKPTSALVSSVNQKPEAKLLSLLNEKNIAAQILDPSQLKMTLDIAEKNTVSHDRIANAYGALKHFPLNDCIVVDINATVTCDFIGKEGHYAGGMIYPGPELSAKYKPTSSLGKTTETQIQSGIYYGLLGAIERLIDELRMTVDSPSSIKVLATGDMTQNSDPIGMISDLEEIVDRIDPYLTLVGLHEIQKELQRR